MRDTSIDYLKEEARYHVILTPLKSWRRNLKHQAIIDCVDKVILEGVERHGYLKVGIYKLDYKTIEDYFSFREDVQEFVFDQPNDIEITSVPTQENAANHYKVSQMRTHGWTEDQYNAHMTGCTKHGDIALWHNVVAEILPIPNHEEMWVNIHRKGKPCESEITKRWKEMKQRSNKKYKYDFTGTEGWNCESVVSYILTGKADPKQGSSYEYLKNLGIVNRLGTSRLS